MAELAAQTSYFLGLEPEVITSCCGSLFGAGGRGVASELAGLPPWPTLISFYGAGGLIAVSGGWLLRTFVDPRPTRRGRLAATLFAGGNLLGFGVAIATIIAFLSLYVYENPNHHCPFCLLKAGYGYIGYVLYLLLFAATAAGLGAGAIAPCRRIPSLQAVISGEARRLTWLALAGFGLFYGLATWLMARSNLILLR